MTDENEIDIEDSKINEKVYNMEKNCMRIQKVENIGMMHLIGNYYIA